jgi:acetyl-CoA carboxylase biotin carboxyl carrier protein
LRRRTFEHRRVEKHAARSGVVSPPTGGRKIASRGSTGGRERATRLKLRGAILAPHPKRGAAVANVEAHITGTVWKIEVEVGDTVEEGDTVVILESMKMEMPVEAEDEGRVAQILCQEGQSVSEGDALVVLE